jgi:hypothetical protein
VVERIDISTTPVSDVYDFLYPLILEIPAECEEMYDI